MFKKQTRYAILLTALASMEGCQTTPSTTDQGSQADGATFCQVARPIHYDDSASLYIRQQIVAHNCIGSALCQWGGEEAAKYCAETLQENQSEPPAEPEAAPPLPSGSGA